MRKDRAAICEAVRAMYPTETAQVIAERLGVPKSYIYRIASEIGVHKSIEVIAAIARDRTNAVTHRSRDTRFAAGQNPWNKGLTYQPGGRSIISRFKPGAVASNTLPVGALRLSKDGYLERKYRQAPGSPSQRWRSEHRLVWEAAHGPVPDGFVVIFRPGQFTAVSSEITLDRIECVSRADLARKNHPRNKSPELAKLVQLKGAITRHINRIAKESANHDQPA